MHGLYYNYENEILIILLDSDPYSHETILYCKSKNLTVPSAHPATKYCLCTSKTLIDVPGVKEIILIALL